MFTLEIEKYIHIQGKKRRKDFNAVSGNYKPGYKMDE